MPIFRRKNCIITASGIVTLCTVQYYTVRRMRATIYMLHYNPRHVSSIIMPIFRRTNRIITASGIVTLCKRLYCTESEDTRCCDNTTFPPEDGHVDARNMSRIVM